MAVSDTIGVAPGVGARQRASQRVRRDPVTMIGLAILVFFVLLASFGYLLTPFGPHDDTGSVLTSPNSDYWMGTDHLARNVFSRFVQGARVSLLVGMVAASLATIIGVTVGALAAYVGGWVDVLSMRVADIVLTIPLLVLGIALASIVGASTLNVVLIIALLAWPSTARLVRSEILSIKEREYTLAATAVGSSRWWIVFREILPNALPIIFVNWSYDVGQAIITEAALSFLGLGDVEAGSWGLMLHDAQRFLRQAWWMSVFPGIGIALSVLSVNLIGEGLNGVFNPRAKRR